MSEVSIQLETISVEDPPYSGVEDWHRLKKDVINRRWTGEQDFIQDYYSQARAAARDLAKEAPLDRVHFLFNISVLKNYSAEDNAIVDQYFIPAYHPLARLIRNAEMDTHRYPMVAIVRLYEGGQDVNIYDRYCIDEGLDSVMDLARQYGLQVEAKKDE